MKDNQICTYVCRTIYILTRSLVPVLFLYLFAGPAISPFSFKNKALKQKSSFKGGNLSWVVSRSQGEFFRLVMYKGSRLKADSLQNKAYVIKEVYRIDD